MLFVSARIKDRNKVVKTISEKQIKQNSRKEAIMMKEDKVMPCFGACLKHLKTGLSFSHPVKKEK